MINKEFTNEKEKRSDEYLMGMTDSAINELVHPKQHILKAYNYYNGVRDPEQFRYLEDNYGLGNPTSIEFTPLIKKHIDALIGEYLDIPLQPKVSCKDQTTISNIHREKQLKIYEEVYGYLSTKLNNAIIKTLTGAQGTDIAIQKEIDNLILDLEENFISEYEIAAQNVLQYIIQSKDIGLQNKLKNMLLDLLIAGMAFYRVRPSLASNNLEIEVLNPLSTFIDYNPESEYLKDGYRSVVVKYMTRSQILMKYGDKLGKTEIDKLRDNIDYHATNTHQMYIRNQANNPVGYPTSSGLLSYKDISPLRPWEAQRKANHTGHLIPVYEVEWLTTNKVDKEYIMDRYESVRIGGNIYILTGKSEDVVRSQSNPNYCSLSINGIYYQDRNSEPFSLMLACAHLQDQYDILHFFRDNLIANSGMSGDFLDMSQLPAFLGTDAVERVQKWIAYKKSAGVALIDSSQEGRAFNNNTVYAGYDDTLKAAAVQAIDLCIERTESTTSGITGVFRERLNGINQKDAVTNVAVGIKNSFTVTKQYYFQMDILTTALCSDALDQSKKVFKNGLSGVLILGDKSKKIFTALSEHFTLTDYDVHVPNSTDMLKQMEEVKMWALELIKSGQMDPTILIEVATASNLTEMKAKVNKAIAKLKKENDALQQLQQQNEELQKQVQQQDKQVQELQAKLEAVNDRKLDLEEKKIMLEDKRENAKIKNDKEIGLETLRLKEEQIKAEVMELFDDNKKNDEVQNVI